KVYGPLEITGARMCLPGTDCPRGPLLLFASNPVDVASLKGRLTISPPLEVEWDRVRADAPYGRQLCPPRVTLPSPYRPATRSRIALAPGVTDQFEQKSDRSQQWVVQTDDLRPALQVGGPHALIEAASGPRLPVEVVNLKSIGVEIWRLTPSEAAKL